MRKRIILNCLPPALVTAPNPAMSVLKAYLLHAGFDVDIEYWNLRLYKLSRGFHLGKNVIDDVESISLFLYYLSMEYGDHNASKYIRSWLMTLAPNRMLDVGFFDMHIDEYINKTNLMIDDIISKYDFRNILFFGFSLSLYQWVVASIIAKRIKQINSSIPIIVGGVGTRESAIAFLDNFPQFDIVIWGEGESVLTQISIELSKNKLEQDFSNIPGIVYRCNNELCVSKNKIREYANLSDWENRPAFSDYFDQLKKYVNQYNIDDIRIPIESSRGCHWCRCNFCFLNTGYQYRLKNVDVLLEEIENVIKEYGIYRFEFLDNDIIGDNHENFNNLLDALIDLRDRYNDFVIIMGEVITKGINPVEIKKMVQAGFIATQIGYESLSDNLLKKINKKNTVASNLLFIKYAYYYHMRIAGMNIIQNLLEETDDDIVEAINNLPFVRFFLSKDRIFHTQLYLAVNHSSKYYNSVYKEMSILWRSKFTAFLPSGFLKKNNEHYIIDYVRLYENSLWDKFTSISAFYLNNDFTYSFLYLNDYFVYSEFQNEVKFKEIKIYYNSLEFEILNITQGDYISIDCLFDKLKSIVDFEFTKVELKNIIDDLYQEFILYHNFDYSEIVSVIIITNI